MSLVITPKSEKDLMEEPSVGTPLEKPTVIEDDVDDLLKNPNTPEQGVETRKIEHPSEFKEAVNKPPENKLYPPANRYPGNSPKPEIPKPPINKTRVFSEDISRMENKKTIENNPNKEKEIDLLRTNIYYTKKMFEEVADLKKTIKIQGYVRNGMSLIIVIATLFSFYFGYQSVKALMSGGLSGLLPSISSSQESSTKNLQGDLIGQALEMLNSNKSTDENSSNLNSLSAEGVNVEEIINQFLK